MQCKGDPHGADFWEWARQLTADIVEGLAPAMLDDVPPTDSRERALWLKQRRGHGPAVPCNWRKRKP